MTSTGRRLVALALLFAGASCGPTLSPGGERPAVRQSSASAVAAPPARETASVADGPPHGDGGPARIESPGSHPTEVARIPLGGARVVRGEHGMVTSEDVLASRIGADVLERGGNAVDAAVAVAFALSVTHPIAGALGGGGFMLLRTKDGGVHALDFRERAPARATETANLRQLRAGAHGYASAPVPGIVAGLTLSRDRFGTRPLRELVAPSIRLAEEGHPLAARQARVLRRLWRKFEDPAMRESLGNGKRPLAKGAVFRQPDLARTLRAIADRGAAGFYRGPVARAIAEAMQANGGLVTEADLAAYEAKERTPLRIDYRGLDVYTMPPPSMGGVAIAAILRNLESFPAIGAKSELTSAHAFIESARRAYADRRTVGVDPDHAATAEHAERLTRLLSREYHARRAPGIDASHATPSALVAPDGDAPAAPESHDTTHFSVVDAEGTAVACTVTLSAGFGAYVRVPKVGVILSNAMGGFSPRGPNALAPGKRMASSMSPTLIVREGKTVAVLGSPGGDTIPNTVAQVLVHLVDHGMTLDDAVDAPRLHHQHLPDETAFERERPLPREVTDGLEALGHTVRVGPRQGSANCIVLDPLSRSAFGYADPRTGGLAIGPARLRR